MRRGGLWRRGAAWLRQGAAYAERQALEASEHDTLEACLGVALDTARQELRVMESELATEHAAYVREVSSARAAMSLRQAALIGWLARRTPSSVWTDFGSGFSSYVLRREAARRPGVRHCSVDDHLGWLEKTREYVASRNLSSADIISWEDWREGPNPPQLGLAYWDFGSTTTRVRVLSEVAATIAPGGLLIVDDMHKAYYRPHVLTLLAADFDLTSAVGLSLDGEGRFAYLARRRGGARPT